MANKQIVNRYCHCVSVRVPCPKKKKQPLIDRLNAEVSTFLEENPDAGMDGVISRFGEPKSIAAAYVEELGADEILDKLHIRSRVLMTVTTVAVIALLLWAIILSIAYADTLQFNRGSGEKNVTEHSSSVE